MFVAWMVLGVVLLLVELHHLAFFALFGAIGAFGAAVVASVAPDALALQAGVGATLTVGGVLAVRPYVSRALEQRRVPHHIPGTRAALVGSEGITLDEVSDDVGTGHIRLYGERWLALSGADRPIPAGVPVVVTAVQGTTLVVWPVDHLALEHGDIEQAGQDDAPDGADGRKT